MRPRICTSTGPARAPAARTTALRALDRAIAAYRAACSRSMSSISMCSSLIEFIKAGIEGREYAKFVFTRSLSDALSLIRQLGEEYGLSIEDCAFLDYDAIRALYSESGSVRERLLESIARGRERHALTRNLVLPPVIASPEDVFAFHLPPSQPNFITRKSVTAPVASVTDPPEQFRRPHPVRAQRRSRASIGYSRAASADSSRSSAAPTRIWRSAPASSASRPSSAPAKRCSALADRRQAVPRLQQSEGLADRVKIVADHATGRCSSRSTASAAIAWIRRGPVSSPLADCCPCLCRMSPKWRSRCSATPRWPDWC